MLSQSNSRLFQAAESGNIVALTALLDQGVDVNSQNGAGLTALHFASGSSGSGQTECVAFLISEGADVNTKSNLGLTAIMIAARDGFIDIVKILIAAGADLDAEVQLVPEAYNHAGCTALTLATKNDIITLLKQAGATETTGTR